MSLGAGLGAALGGFALGAIFNSIFGSGQPKAALMPKRKSLFFVDFRGPQLIQRVKSNLAFMVETIDRPKYSTHLQELSQYGKRRLAQTKMDYDDITISFYDTYDQEAMLMFQHYFAFYYGDGIGKTSDAWNYDITTPKFENVPNWGFSIDYNGNTNNSYFFTSIDIHEFYGGLYSKTRLIHPKVHKFDFERFDKNSMDVMKVHFSIKYEGVVFDLVNTPLTSNLYSQAGLTPPDTNSGLFSFFDFRRISAGSLSNIFGSSPNAPSGIPGGNFTETSQFKDGTVVTWATKGRPDDLYYNWNDPPCQTDTINSAIAQQAIYRRDPRATRAGNRLLDQRMAGRLPGPLGYILPRTSDISFATVTGGSSDLRNLSGSRVLGNLGFGSGNIGRTVAGGVTRGVSDTLGINDPNINRAINTSATSTMSRGAQSGSVSRNNRSVF